MYGIHFQYNESDMLNGIFEHYSYKSTPKLFSKLFQIHASSVEPTRGDITTLIDHTINIASIEYNWLSENVPNSSFTISFIGHKFKIESYTFKGRTDNYMNIPGDWKAEGSNDKINWNLINYHNRSDPNSLEGEKGKMINMNCTQNCDLYFRNIKFTMLNENLLTNDNNDTYRFALNKVELFGTLKIEFFSCQGKHSFQNFLHFYQLQFILFL